MEQLDDLLTGAEVRLTDDVLDTIDEIAAPGTDISRLDMVNDPPAIGKTTLRRRPIDECTAT